MSKKGKFMYKKRDCLMYAVICEQSEVFNLLCEYMELEKHLSMKDVYGKTLAFYMKQYGFNIESVDFN